MGKLMSQKDQIEAVPGEHTVTLKQFIDDYRLNILPRKRLSKASLDSYQTRHRQIANALGAIPLDRISLTHICYFLAENSPCVSNQNRTALIDLFKHAAAQGLLERNVAAYTLKREYLKHRKRHTKAGIKAIRDHAPQWLKNAIDLGLLLSQRPCVLLNLRFDDIEDGHMLIKVQNDFARLKVEITPELEKVIDQCRDGVDSPFLIHRQPDRKRDYDNKEYPTQITRECLTREFKKARDAAKCYPSYSAKEMPGMHEIRFTSLKTYYRAGKDVKRIAGYSSSNITNNWLMSFEHFGLADFSPDLNINEFIE